MTDPTTWTGRDVTPPCLLPRMPRYGGLRRLLLRFGALPWRPIPLGLLVAAHADAWRTTYGPGALVFPTRPYRLMYVRAADIPDLGLRREVYEAGRRSMVVLITDGTAVRRQSVDRDGNLSGGPSIVVPVRRFQLARARPATEPHAPVFRIPDDVLSILRRITSVRWMEIGGTTDQPPVVYVNDGRGLAYASIPALVSFVTTQADRMDDEHTLLVHLPSGTAQAVTWGEAAAAIRRQWPLALCVFDLAWGLLALGVLYAPRHASGGSRRPAHAHPTT